METVKQNVRFVMERLSFPEQDRAVFLAALDQIATDPVATAWLTRMITQYDENENCHYSRLLADSKALGEVLGIHEYTMAMLLFLCFAERLRERYAERELCEEVYWNSMADLRYKLEECHLVHGVVGSFVAPWFGWRRTSARRQSRHQHPHSPHGHTTFSRGRAGCLSSGGGMVPRRAWRASHRLHLQLVAALPVASHRPRPHLQSGSIHRGF